MKLGTDVKSYGALPEMDLLEAKLSNEKCHCCEIVAINTLAKAVFWHHSIPSSDQ